MKDGLSKFGRLFFESKIIMGVVLMVARGIPNPKVAVRVRTPMPI